MIAVEGDMLIYAAVGGLCLGIVLAVFDDWFKRRQRSKRRHRGSHHP
jgi:membrane associated rhomboid family serine protease